MANASSCARASSAARAGRVTENAATRGGEEDFSGARVLARARTFVTVLLAGSGVAIVLSIAQAIQLGLIQP